MPWPWTHSYSVPERSTPRSTICWPLALTSSFPDTRSCATVLGPPDGGLVDDRETYRPIPAAAAAASTMSFGTMPRRDRAGRGFGRRRETGSPSGLSGIVVADGNFTGTLQNCFLRVGCLVVASWRMRPALPQSGPRSARHLRQIPGWHACSTPQEFRSHRKRSTEALSKSSHVWLNFPNSIEVVLPTPIEVAARRTQPCCGRLATPGRSRPGRVMLLWSTSCWPGTSQHQPRATCIVRMTL